MPFRALRLAFLVVTMALGFGSASFAVDFGDRVDELREMGIIPSLNFYYWYHPNAKYNNYSYMTVMSFDFIDPDYLKALKANAEAELARAEAAARVRRDLGEKIAGHLASIRADLVTLNDELRSYELQQQYLVFQTRALLALGAGITKPENIAALRFYANNMAGNAGRALLATEVPSMETEEFTLRGAFLLVDVGNGRKRRVNNRLVAFPESAKDGKTLNDYLTFLERHSQNANTGTDAQLVLEEAVRKVLAAAESKQDDLIAKQDDLKQRFNLRWQATQDAIAALQQELAAL